MTAITLATLKDATAQEVFNQVVIHLLKQQISSGLVVDNHYRCYYRHPNNASIKCAAGCLISDEEYDYGKMDDTRSMETTWDALIDRGVVPPFHKDLISSLQSIHDSNVDLGFTVADFSDIAKYHGLVLPEIYNEN